MSFTVFPGIKGMTHTAKVSTNDFEVIIINPTTPHTNIMTVPTRPARAISI